MPGSAPTGQHLMDTGQHTCGGPHSLERCHITAEAEKSRRGKMTLMLCLQAL